MPRAPQPPSRRRARPGASAARRPAGLQPELPFRPPKRAGAQKIRATDGPPPITRRVALLLLGLVTVLLVANAIAGERGLVQTLLIQRDRQALADEIAGLQRENRQLAAQAERLRHDPGAVEELARGELGLIRPGEQLFIIVDRPLPGR